MALGDVLVTIPKAKFELLTKSGGDLLCAASGRQGKLNKHKPIRCTCALREKAERTLASVERARCHSSGASFGGAVDLPPFSSGSEEALDSGLSSSSAFPGETGHGLFKKHGAFPGTPQLLLRAFGVWHRAFFILRETSGKHVLG